MPTSPLPVLLLLALMAQVQAAAEESLAHLETAMRGAIAAVDPADGIDAVEARMLALAYLRPVAGGCGGLEEARLDGSMWSFDSRVGRGAVPGPRVLVARDGISVHAEGHPTVRLAAGTVVVMAAAEHTAQP
jgi:hypothetical protein